MISKNISSFVKTSFCDWPGKISSIIFVRNCNFRCPTCHNFELLETNETLEPEELFNKIFDNYRWINHLTISGGEPTIYNDLYDLVKFFNDNNFIVKVDSNGSRPDMIEKLMPITSLFSIDIKAPFYKYPEVTGYRIDEKTIKEKFEYIISLSKINPDQFQFRTTLVPSLTNEDIEEIKSYFPPDYQIQFQDYKEIN
ncbi:MAG: anaerobic ribonucleoside-triphosphate reductase activating protein [Nanoarchaeota archaeon]